MRLGHQQTHKRIFTLFNHLLNSVVGEAGAQGNAQHQQRPKKETRPEHEIKPKIDSLQIAYTICLLVFQWHQAGRTFRCTPKFYLVKQCKNGEPAGNHVQRACLLSHSVAALPTGICHW